MDEEEDEEEWDEDYWDSSNISDERLIVHMERKNITQRLDQVESRLNEYIDKNSKLDGIVHLIDLLKFRALNNV